MGVKSAIKAVSPPILLSLIKREEVQPSWAAACRKAGTYEADLLNRFRIARSAARIVDGSLLKASVLNLVAMLFGGDALEITDLGGATGDLGADFLQAYPHAHYTVVENATMVSLMAGKSPVQFTTAIPASCDMFFTSSTLQYLANPLEVLNEGLLSARRAVILVRNSFSEKEIFRVQRSRLFDNGSGPIPDGYSDREITYPHRTIKESSVMALAEAQGFRCVSRLEENSGSLNGTYGKQIVFLRKTAD